MRLGALEGEALPQSEGQALPHYSVLGSKTPASVRPQLQGKRRTTDLAGYPLPGSGLHTGGGYLSMSAGSSLAAFPCQGLPGKLTTTHQPSTGHWQGHRGQDLKGACQTKAYKGKWGAHPSLRLLLHCWDGGPDLLWGRGILFGNRALTASPLLLPLLPTSRWLPWGVRSSPPHHRIERWPP